MRVRGNDYRSIRPAEDFTPELRVSVIIPAYGGQHQLDLVLAGLARQTYPADLTEVIVVDNGSTPALRLPADRPPHTRLVRCETPGRGNARNAGLAEAGGEVIHWLDSDVVPTAGAVMAHMRWHHAAPYLAVTGYLRFSEAPLPDKLPDDLEAHFEPAEPHAWIVRLIERTNGLTDTFDRPFSLHVGGATSVNARLIEAAGPMDGELVLGQDTEMGYRLMQAGAVFVPEPEAVAYHLGPTMRMRHQERIDRVSYAFVGDRVPAYRWLRRHPGRQWKIPYLEVLVDGTAGYDTVRATVDALLAGTAHDLRVVVVGPWDTLDRDRRAPLQDPNLELVLVQGHYAFEPRVRLATSHHVDPAVPYVLRLPPGWAPGEDTVAALLERARTDGLGLLNVLLDETPGGVVAARLEHAASFARARLLAGPGEDLDDVVDEVSGVAWAAGESYGFATEQPEPQGRRSAYRVRLKAKAEAERLGKEAERLRGEVARWRDEAGKWRKSAVEYRREIAALRKEVAGLRRDLAAAERRQRTLRAALSARVRRALRK
ncbi:glycosyltransferase [Nonomuraea sp. MCN248]|uniref:Glycosyltransferase n=1 Tax=Nonomuraea corallina TaxID=2989783 RepID=A0ABT4SEJ1_9ACTN|nr:glycosyltransferase [Nonomuraea corallina]MDA0635617.1 glycosyltransferase [Nonomuraea corallina]